MSSFCRALQRRLPSGSPARLTSASLFRTAALTPSQPIAGPSTCSGSRVTTVTSCPAPVRAWHRAVPMKPVPPVTRTRIAPASIDWGRTVKRLAPLTPPEPPPLSWSARESVSTGRAGGRGRRRGAPLGRPRAIRRDPALHTRAAAGGEADERAPRQHRHAASRPPLALRLPPRDQPAPRRLRARGDDLRQRVRDRDLHRPERGVPPDRHPPRRARRPLPLPEAAGERLDPAPPPPRARLVDGSRGQQLRPHRLLERPRAAEDTTDAAVAWLRRKRERPFFLWVHYIDPHGPYTAPPPFDRRFSGGASRRVKEAKIPAYQRIRHIAELGYYVDQYDGEIAYTDEHLGRLLAEADALGLFANTMVVL